MSIHNDPRVMVRILQERIKGLEIPNPSDKRAMLRYTSLLAALSEQLRINESLAREMDPKARTKYNLAFLKLKKARPQIRVIETTQVFYSPYSPKAVDASCNSIAIKGSQEAGPHLFPESNLSSEGDV